MFGVGTHSSSRKCIRTLLISLQFSFLAIATTARAQNEPPLTGHTLPSGPPADPSVLHVNVNMAILDVVVRDKSGKSIHGLSQSDFRLLEDHRTQSIVLFEEHRASKTSQARSNSTLPEHVYADNTPYAATSTVFLFDTLNADAVDLSNARGQLLKDISEFPPNESVAVFVLGLKLRMIRGFSTDVVSAIKSLNEGKATTPEKALSSTADSDHPIQANANSSSASTSPSHSSPPSSNLAAFSNDESASLREEARAEATIAGLAQLSHYLSSIPGRKNVLWFSAGFPQILGDLATPWKITNFTTDIRPVDEALARARVALYPIDCRGLLTSPAASFAKQEDLKEGAGLQSSISYAFADNRDAPLKLWSEHQTMLQMATDTGGEAFFDTNAIGRSAIAAISSGSDYYTLGYVPTNRKYDGTLRMIEVFLPEAHYELSYRRHYFSDGFAQKGKPVGTDASPMTIAMAESTLPLSQVTFQVRALPVDVQASNAQHESSKSPPKTRRYILDYIVDPRSVQLKSLPEGRAQAEFELAEAVYDIDGKRLKAQDVGLEANLAPKDMGKIFKTGLQIHREIDVPQDGSLLKLGVRDATSGSIGTIAVSIVR